MKQGSLVLPISIQTLTHNGVVYLTPCNLYEDWLEWHPNELGIVLSFEEKSETIKVIVPSGIGFCLFDEVKEIKS